MNQSLFTAPSKAPDRCVGDRATAAARDASRADGTSTQDRAFIALQNAYRAHGGLSRLQGLNAGGCVRSGQRCDVEDLVAAGELFGFEWFGAMWIPLFQFDLPGPTLAVRPQRVVAELGCHFDGWELASWFVEPNSWLANHVPIDLLASRMPDVLEAARADRFVATG